MKNLFFVIALALVTVSCVSWSPAAEYQGKVLRGRVEELYSKAKLEDMWNKEAERELRSTGSKITKEQFLNLSRAWVVVYRRPIVSGLLAAGPAIPPGLQVEVGDFVDFYSAPPPYGYDPNQAKILRIVCKHTDSDCITKKGKRGIVLNPDNPNAQIQEL